MNKKGQGSLFSLFAIVMGLIVLTALLPVISMLVVEITSTTLINHDAFFGWSIIQFLLTAIGLFMVLLFLMGAISDFQTKQQYY